MITKTCTPGIIRSNNTAQSSTPPGIVFKLSLEACCYSLNMFNCFYESCEQKFFCFIVHGLHNHIHITWDNLLLWTKQTCNKRFSECHHTWWNWDASRQRTSLTGSFKDFCLNVCKWDGLNIFFKWERPFFEYYPSILNDNIIEHRWQVCWCGRVARSALVLRFGNVVLLWMFCCCFIGHYGLVFANCWMYNV